MSLSRNILFSYASQIYVTLISIVMVPMYVRYLGAETFGLVSFFAVLQVWFLLLDMGLSPTMAREVARFNGGATDAVNLRRLLRAMEGIFVAVALLAGATIIFGAGAIASKWLNVQQLSQTEVQHAIMLMAVIVGLRWICGLYRSVVSGFERFAWIGVFNCVVATARFVLVIPFFVYVGTSPTQFFSYQLVLTAVEAALLMLKTYRLLPKLAEWQRTHWEWEPLRSVLKFSLSLALTSSAWALVTQTDKLVLSKLLSLSDYAYFSLAVLVASSVTVIIAPLSGVMLPSMTRLNASGNEVSLIRLYRNATQLVALFAIPSALLFAYFPEQVLSAWIGNAAIAEKAAPVLTLYALGNGILAVGSFPYYLQFAKGDVKLHMIGNCLFALILIPASILATLEYGAIGAGWSWLGANIVYFLVWVPFVHESLAKNLHYKWLIKDVFPIALMTVLAATITKGLVDFPQSRHLKVATIIIIGLQMLITASASSSWMREAVLSKCREYLLRKKK